MEKKSLVLSTQQCKRLVVYGSESRSQSQEWISWQILELSFIVIAFAIIIVTITIVIIITINIVIIIIITLLREMPVRSFSSIIDSLQNPRNLFLF